MNWHGETLWEAIAPHLPGFTVEVLPQLDSTNSELMRRAKAGDVSPILLVAEQQTQGRGRLGRSWHSARTDGAAGAPALLDSLTFSLGLPLAPADWSGLSLAVGVSLADSLDPGRRCGVQLKWPNDLLYQQRKWGGVLIETAPCESGPQAGQRYAVIGVGINLSAAAVSAEGLRTPAAWLGEWQPLAAPDAPGTLAQMALPLVQTVLAFEVHGFAPFQARFHARDALLDRSVHLSDGSRGTALGVSETGALTVHTASGLHRVSSAEVSVQPPQNPSNLS